MSAPTEAEKKLHQNSASSQQSSSDAEIGADFVFVNKNELPAPDSEDIQKILPPVHQPKQQLPQQPDSSTTTAESNILPSSSTKNEKVEAEPEKATTTSPTSSISIPDDLSDSSVNEEAAAAAIVNNLKRLVNKHDPNDPLFARRYLVNKKLSNKDDDDDDVNNRFSVASYNILADCHALRGIKEWGQYKWTTEDNLALKHRKIRLHRELEYLNADVYCLQEVSPTYFHDELLPLLTSWGYEGFFIKRDDEECDEGEATFFRTSRFTLVKSQGYVLHELAEKEMKAMNLSEEKMAQVLSRVKAPGVLLCTKLECNNTGTNITIGNIHVTWGQLKMPDMQCVQIGCAIKEVVSQAGGADKPHIICGDFNSVPTSAGYHLARDGYLNDDIVTELQYIKEVDLASGDKAAVVDLWWKGFQHTSSSLKSSYDTVQGCEPPSSKFPHDGVIRNVDYIWYSSSTLDLSGVAELVPSIFIQAGIPDDTIPSDHLSLKAVYTIK